MVKKQPGKKCGNGHLRKADQVICKYEYVQI